MPPRHRLPTSTLHAERASHWWFLYVAVRRLGPLNSEDRGHMVAVYQVRARRTLALPLR